MCVVQGEGEPDSVDRPGALMEMRPDHDTDENGKLILHTFSVRKTLYFVYSWKSEKSENVETFFFIIFF